MAEASSSGGEASEEEEDGSDEASPSDGEITAASPPPPLLTNKRKKLRYLQDYLKRLPKHQRKRIQKEIDKGYKPGETAAMHTATKFNVFPTLLIEWLLLINRPRVY